MDQHDVCTRLDPCAQEEGEEGSVAQAPCEEASPSLGAQFLASVPEARRACFAALPDLEGALAGLLTKGREAWPALPLAAEDFMAFLGRRLPEDVAGQLEALRGDDLWLTCAFGLGVPGAAEAIDKRGFVGVGQVLGRLGASREAISDISQELRKRLLEMHDPGRDERGYAGRGGLSSWLRVCAVRAWNRQRARGARDLSMEAGPLMAASPGWEPEFALLMRTHKRELTAAFQEALASLSSRERNVLRYHLIDELNIDRIGGLYGVHRATAARWVNQAKEALFTQTRALFRSRVSVSDAEFQRVVVLLESQIRVHLVEAAQPTGTAGDEAAS